MPASAARENARGSDRLWLGACGAICVLAAYLRLTGLQEQLFLHRDDSGILVWARTLAITGQYEFTLARPGYVTLLAAPIRLTGELVHGPLFSIIAGVASIALTALWAWRLVSPAGAAIAAAVVSSSLLHNFYSRSQQPAMMVTLCTLIASVLVIDRHAIRARQTERFFLAGLVLGVALTFHPSTILFPFMFVGFTLLLFLERGMLGQLPRAVGGMLVGVALPVVGMQLLTTAFAKPGPAPVDFFTQFQSAYGYQSAGTNHVTGTEDLWYYPLSLQLVEGPGWIEAAAVIVMWSIARLLWRRQALMAILLTQTVGLVTVWSVAGAIGAADHLRVILPALPSLAILAAFLVHDLVGGLSRFGRLPMWVGAGSTLVLVASIAGWGALQAQPLMSATTGFLEVSRFINSARGSDEQVIIIGGNDRSWRLLIDPDAFLPRAPEPENRRRSRAAGRASESKPAVRGVNAVGEAVQPSGGVECFLILSPEADVLGNPGSPGLPRILTERYASVPRATQSAPVLVSRTDWVRFPIYRLEGADTGVQQVEGMGRNGINIPEQARFTEVYRLTGGTQPGCSPRE